MTMLLVVNNKLTLTGSDRIILFIKLFFIEFLFISALRLLFLQEVNSAAFQN